MKNMNELLIKREEKEFFDNLSNDITQEQKNWKSNIPPKFADIYQGKLWLDICCGTGRNANLAAAHGRLIVFGIDISPKMIKIATKNARILKTGASFIIADAENLPFHEEVFDVVYGMSALHHLPNPKKGIVEMYRVLKQKGEVIIGQEPSCFFKFRPLFDTSVIQKLHKFIHPNDYCPLELRSPIEAKRPLGFSHKKLYELFTDAGFSEVNVTGIEYIYSFWKVFGRTPPSFLKKLFVKFDKCLSRIPIIRNLSYNLSATAKKRV